MPIAVRRHPVLRHLDTLVFFLGIGVAAALSGLVNLHSVAWLLSFFATASLLIVARRKLRGSTLLGPYCLYLFWMNQYMLLVWFLHVWVPGPNSAKTSTQVLFWAHALGLGSIFLPIAWYRFTLQFSGVKARALKWIEYAGWVLAAIIAITNFTGDFTREYFWSGYTWVPKVEAWYSVYFVYTTFFVFLDCIIPVIQSARTQSHQHRLQLFYYSLGAVPLLMSCWMNFLISLGFKLYPAGGLFFLAHVLVLAYAVLVRRVFDITFAIKRGLAYALVSVLLGTLYPTVLWLGSRYSIGNPANGAITIFVFALIAGLFYAPLHHLMQKFVDRVFFRHDSDRQRLLQEFIQQTATHPDLNSLGRAICKVSQSVFQSGKVSLFVNDNRGRPILFGTYVNDFKAAEWPFGEQLAVDVAQVTAEGTIRLKLSDIQPQGKSIAFTGETESLVVPIVHKEQNLGFLILGPKRADEPYDDGDLSFAATVATHFSIALSNGRTLAQLEHWQRTMVRMIEGMTAGIIMTDKTGRIIRINTAAIRLLGSSQQLQKVEHLDQLDAECVEFIRVAVKEQRIFTNKEIVIRTVPRQIALVTVESVGTFDAQEFFLVYVHDITEYKTLEQESLKKESLAQVGSYVSSINHELLNMLQPLQHQIQLMVRSNTTEPKSIAIIGSQAEALQRTLKSLQDIARPIDLRIRRLNVRSMIDSVLCDVRDQPVSVGTQLGCKIRENSAFCDGDAHWLRQVIYNLVKNAAEACFGGVGAVVTITSTRNDAEFTIAVCDNGPGMEESVKAKLFRPFFSTKALAGTGLGLCISKKIIELHGGRIEVQSAPGKGSIFSIVLPTAHSEIDAPSSESISADV
jgi:PAS domain S-box-containing protein